MKNISTSACPHDCPSTCVLDIVHDQTEIYGVRGNKDNSYTKGVVCAKVSRYRERTHNKKRLLKPLIRVGEKGSGDFKVISWGKALNIISNKIKNTSENFGTEAIWPYYYAGTMGLLQRDGINRLRNIFRFSGQYSTICTTLPQTGWMAGIGSLMGPDPREVTDSEIIVVWGGNPASTQVNFMKHVQNARKKNKAILIVIDPYLNKTAKIADYHVKLRPGTDGALACAIMNYIFKNKCADTEYIKKFTKDYNDFEEHIKEKSAEWASEITGITPEEIINFSNLISSKKRVFFRIGYGFTRQRNGSFNMHAVTCIPTILGSWRYKGGGAFYSNGGIYKVNKSLIEGIDFKDQKVRELDQSRIGPVLNNDKEALKNGCAVKVLFVQNTNPLVVAPDTNLVREGFKRKDLFVCVHEQFLTETAKFADIVLPATTFVEHNDIYISGGHQHLTLGPQLIKPVGESWSNHKLINKLGKLLGSKNSLFNYTENELIDKTLLKSRLGSLKKIRNTKFFDLQPDFEEAHFLKGFGHKDKKFHFAPKWKDNSDSFNKQYRFPDHYPLIESTNEKFPYKLITSPAHNFLNTSFTETETSRKKENKPTIKIHSSDLKKLKVKDDEIVKIGNARGVVKIHVEKFDGLLKGVTVVEGIWPNEYFLDNNGINTLVGSDAPEPAGGAVFHDIAIWIRKL